MRVLKWIVAIIAAPFVFAFFYAMTNRVGPPQAGAVEERQKAVEAERAKHPAPNWTYSTQADPMSKGIEHSASVTSSNTFNLDSPYQGEQHAMLTIRDHPKFGKDVIFQIERGQLICGVSSCRISVRFDEGNPQSFTASEPSDYDSKYLFIRDYARFTQNMRKAKIVRIAPTIYQHGEIPMTFAVQGFDADKFSGKTK